MMVIVKVRFETDDPEGVSTKVLDVLKETVPKLATNVRYHTTHPEESDA